jgi:hypothetical protein
MLNRERRATLRQDFVAVGVRGESYEAQGRKVLVREENAGEIK